MVTSYSLPVLQAASSDGGIFFGGLVILPVAFVGLVLAVTLGSVVVESRVENFGSVWAIAIAVVSALVLVAVVRVVLTVPVLEVELVTISSTLFFPLGVAARRRNWLSFGVIGSLLAAGLYSMTHIFSNTFGEVIPLTVAAGIVFSGIGYFLVS